MKSRSGNQALNATFDGSFGFKYHKIKKINNMKHLKLTILFLFIAPFLALGQWEEKNIATIFTLTSVKFFDDHHGFIAGGNNIFKTENGGDFWETSFNGFGNIFFEDVFLIGTNKIMAVGKNFDSDQSVIVKSENNGNSWETVNISNSAYLKSIFFIISKKLFKIKIYYT